MANAAAPVKYSAVSLVPFPPGTSTPAPNPLFVGANPPLNPVVRGALELEEAPLILDDVGDDDEPDDP